MRLRLWLYGLVVGLVSFARADESGLILSYDFEQTNGAVVTDRSGTGNDGMLQAVASGVGVNGWGAHLDGVSACVKVPLSDSIRSLTNAFSIEEWVSPEDASFGSLLWAPSDPDPNAHPAIRLEWRGPAWNFWILLTTADGEMRLVQPACNSTPELTIPVPTWYHLVGTYDGQTATLYINGRVAATQTYPTRKSLQPFIRPLTIGITASQGYPFRGRMDEIRIFNRALSAAEALAAYERRSAFTPTPESKAVAGTIDGKPYAPATHQTAWLRCALIPPESGTVNLSNTGEFYLLAGRGALYTGLNLFSLLDQVYRGPGFYREVTGMVRLHPPGVGDQLELDGVAYDGRRIRQKIQIASNNDIRVRYDVSVTNGTVAPVAVAWGLPLRETAMAFVSTENGRRVTGRAMDLARTAVFEDAAEITLARSGSRLFMDLGPNAVWRAEGKRDPADWLGGWSVLNGQIRSRHEIPAGTLTNSLAYGLRVTDDATPPLLSAQGAEEITPELPFDFTTLKESWPGAVAIALPGHEAPIYGLGEDIRIEFGMTNLVASTNGTRYEIKVEDAFSNAVIHVEKGAVPVPCASWVGRLTLKAPAPGVYNVSARFTDATGKELGAGARELAVAGPIPQPVRQPSEALNLELVDSADLTLADPGHDYYSCSGKSPVVTTNGVTYREILAMRDMQAEGTDRRDFVGVKLALKNSAQDHVVEVVYADLDDTVIGVQVYEPVANAASDPRTCINRLGAGVISGGVYPHDGKLKRMTTEFIPSGTSRWCAVSCINLYVPAAGVAKISLYEVKGGLPRLPSLPNDRLIGVHTESGNVGIGTFGYGALAGAYYCPRDRFYLEHYRAIANMIRVLRFRGENMYDYGVYRYNTANFPSKHMGFNPASRRLDLPGLMAKMFEYNDLKIVLNVAPQQPLNIARHYRRSTWDVIQGTAEPRQIAYDGKMDAGHFYFQPANPFHTVIQDEYAKYADELGERYGGAKSFAGVSWLQGAAGLGEPCVYQWGYNVRKDDTNAMNDFFFRYTYDDVTMEQFQEFAGVKLPGTPGDPARFQQRYDWILANAREKWIQFRCDAMYRVHRRLAETLHRRAPSAKYYLLDYFGIFLNNDLPDMAPLDIVRRVCSDPRLFTNQSAVVYCPYVPTIDASQFKEFGHGAATRERAMKSAQFAREGEFYATCDSGADCARYLHRQFFETCIVRAPGRPWVFPANRDDTLGQITYPQPVGANWMADYAIMLAYATPNFITWMWCDGLYPSGQYEEMQAFALAYRQLPLGVYRTVKHEGAVFVRASKRAFYVVETEGRAARCELPPEAGKGSYRDVVTGETLTVGPRHTVTLNVRPYDFRVFARK